MYFLRINLSKTQTNSKLKLLFMIKYNGRKIQSVFHGSFGHICDIIFGNFLLAVCSFHSCSIFPRNYCDYHARAQLNVYSVHNNEHRCNGD